MGWLYLSHQHQDTRKLGKHTQCPVDLVQGHDWGGSLQQKPTAPLDGTVKGHMLIYNT